MKLFFKNPKTVQGKLPRHFGPARPWRNKYFAKKKDYPRLQMLKHPLIEAHQKQLL